SNLHARLIPIYPNGLLACPNRPTRITVLKTTAAVGTSVFLVLAVIRPVSSGVATGLSTIAALTISNPLWWTALSASLVIGCAVVASWQTLVKR
ncbi:MAG: hypothetical protein WAK48_03825, partial [Candidatus Acidiferrum sp.]